LKINTNTPKAANVIRSAEPVKEISKTEKGPAKRDSQQIIIANTPAQVESREVRTSNISKKSKTSKPANTKSKTLKSQKTANSKVTNSPSNRISKKKDLDDSNQESDVDSADSFEEESDVEISIEEVDELSELGADQRGIPSLHQSNTYATNQKHTTNKKAKKRSGSASSEEAEDDFVCVPLSNLNKDTMTFQNREMLMKKSLMLSEVSGLNDQKNDGNFDSNRGDGAIRSLVMFGGSQLIGRGGTQEPHLPGSMIIN
jgi:ATP-dependent helicase YprA (DUF1998 family)